MLQIKSPNSLPITVRFHCDFPTRTVHCYGYETDNTHKPTIPLLYSSAYCAPMDRWDKRKGRKLAFARAISVWSKTVRKQAWTAYQDFFVNDFDWSF